MRDDVRRPRVVGGDHRDLAAFGLETGEIMNAVHDALRAKDDSVEQGRRGEVSGTCLMDQVLREVRTEYQRSPFLRIGATLIIPLRDTLALRWHNGAVSRPPAARWYR